MFARQLTGWGKWRDSRALNRLRDLVPGAREVPPALLLAYRRQALAVWAESSPLGRLIRPSLPMRLAWLGLFIALLAASGELAERGGGWALVVPVTMLALWGAVSGAVRWRDGKLDGRVGDLITARHNAGRLPRCLGCREVAAEGGADVRCRACGQSLLADPPWDHAPLAVPQDVDVLRDFQPHEARGLWNWAVEGAAADGRPGIYAGTVAVAWMLVAGIGILVLSVFISDATGYLLTIAGIAWPIVGIGIFLVLGSLLLRRAARREAADLVGPEAAKVCWFCGTSMSTPTNTCRVCGMQRATRTAGTARAPS